MTNAFRKLPVALALAAAGLAFNAVAQTNPAASPSGPNNASSQKAGEAYPNSATAATNKQTPEVIQKAENSKPAKATKRVAKKTGKAVSDTAKTGANAVERTGDKMAAKLPPAKGPSAVDAQGQPKVAP